MKRFLTVLLFIIIFCTQAYSAQIYSEKKMFGLKNDEGQVVAEPIYSKMIRLGDDAYIICKSGKYGIMSASGEILVKPKYSYADRFFDIYVKLGNTNNYGVFNDKGEEVIPPEYSTIELLSGKMILTVKDYKYGIMDYDGNVVLRNVFDDIYMPNAKTLRVQYNGKWYQVEQLSDSRFELPKDLKTLKDDKNYKIIKEDKLNPVGYSAITLTDYMIKIFSSISPAHEEVVDELLLSHGADTVSVWVKQTWIPKYPLTFIRKYYSILRTPNNGPLTKFRYKKREKAE